MFFTSFDQTPHEDRLTGIEARPLCFLAQQGKRARDTSKKIFQDNQHRRHPSFAGLSVWQMHEVCKRQETSGSAKCSGSPFLSSVEYVLSGVHSHVVNKKMQTLRSRTIPDLLLRDQPGTPTRATALFSILPRFRLVPYPLGRILYVLVALLRGSSKWKKRKE